MDHVPRNEVDPADSPGIYIRGGNNQNLAV